MVRVLEEHIDLHAAEYEALAEFRHQLRNFLAFSEQAARAETRVSRGATSRRDDSGGPAELQVFVSIPDATREYGSYVVVEKSGIADGVAEEQDPRG